MLGNFTQRALGAELGWWTVIMRHGKTAALARPVALREGVQGLPRTTGRLGPGSWVLGPGSKIVCVWVRILPDLSSERLLRAVGLEVAGGPVRRTRGVVGVPWVMAPKGQTISWNVGSNLFYLYVYMGLG